MRRSESSLYKFMSEFMSYDGIAALLTGHSIFWNKEKQALLLSIPMGFFLLSLPKSKPVIYIPITSTYKCCYWLGSHPCWLPSLTWELPENTRSKCPWWTSTKVHKSSLFHVFDLATLHTSQLFLLGLRFPPPHYYLCLMHFSSIDMDFWCLPLFYRQVF